MDVRITVATDDSGVPHEELAIGALQLVQGRPLSFGAFNGRFECNGHRKRRIHVREPRVRALKAAYADGPVTLLPFRFGCCGPSVWGSDKGRPCNAQVVAVR